MQNTQYCATLTTMDGSELTVSRSSTNLQKKYHQHASAICKEIEALRYIRYIADSGEMTALFNDAVRFNDCRSIGVTSVPCGAFLYFWQGVQCFVLIILVNKTNINQFYTRVCFYIISSNMFRL
jgi:hypothetical protein